jgi:hypothetical protein
MHRRASFAELGEGARRGRQIGLKTHLLGDPKELLLSLQQLEEFSKILEGSRDYIPGFVCAALAGKGSKGRDLSLPAVKHG